MVKCGFSCYHFIKQKSDKFNEETQNDPSFKRLEFSKDGDSCSTGAFLRAQRRAEGLWQPQYGLGLCCTLGKKRTARFLCLKQKNILKMLHIICHSQLWYRRRNTRQDVPWPGMDPAAGEKVEKRLLWEPEAGDRSKKAAPNPPEEQGRSWAPFRWALLTPKLGQGMQTGPGGFRNVLALLALGFSPACYHLYYFPIYLKAAFFSPLCLQKVKQLNQEKAREEQCA